MAEENIENNKPVEPPALTATEQKALEQGWVPQDQWEGEPDAWRPAKEFLDRGELFKKIDEQNRMIKQLKMTQAEFAKHYEKVAETEYKRALADLKRQKKEALLEGDTAKALDLDEAIEDHRERGVPRNAPQVAPEPQLNPVFVNWVEKNSWYEHNDAMRAYADKVGNELGMSGMSPVDILSEVERRVKKEFLHKFENPRRKAAASVEGEGQRANNNKKDDFELSDVERRVMQRFVRQGVLTEEQYIKDLKKQRGVL